MPRPNIPYRERAIQGLLLADSQVGTFELSLYDTFIHVALTLLEYLRRKAKYNNNNNNNNNNNKTLTIVETK